MCLTTSRSTPDITTYDIICYKIVQPLNGEFVSPFWRHHYKLGELYSIENWLEELFNQNRELPSGLYGVCEGFHAYLRLDRAEYIERQFSRGVTIVKCMIPEGSEYFISDDNFEIVANNIKILSVCA